MTRVLKRSKKIEVETGCLELPGGGAVSFRYHRSGSGVPFVLNNGLVMDTSLWVALFRAYYGYRPILLWDYRFCGSSPRRGDRGDISISTCADDLHRLVAHLGIGKSVVVGHSMGVQICLEYAGRYSSDTEAVIGFSGTYGAPYSSLFGKAAPGFLSDLAARSMKSAGKFINPAWYPFAGSQAVKTAASIAAIDGAGLREGDKDGYLRNLGRIDLETFGYYASEMCSHSARTHLVLMKSPALFITGTRDPWSPPSVAREMAALAEDGEYLLIPRGRHLALLDFADLYTKKIDRFLHRCFGEKISRE